jgi:FkbM family methyltransferase
MQVEWLKRRIRGTPLHWILRRVLKRPAADQPNLIFDANTAYDQQTLEVMRRILKRDSSCIDVGAHNGDILRHMIEVAPAGNHHAFEALPHLAARLREKFPDAHVHSMAASDKSGRADFQYVENDPAYSGLRRRIYDRPDPQISTIQVEVATLDEVIPAEQPIAFIKMDIEGGEYHALKGATNIIRRWQPVIVFEAGSKSTGQYGISPSELFSLVTTFGYNLSTMRRWLDQAAPFTVEGFCQNWENGPDFYFIATAT